MKQTNISVFIPHSGCKNTCSFCNQKTISGCDRPVTPEQLEEILSEQQPVLESNDTRAQIAFFGGSFTAIDRDYMCDLLKTASEFTKKHPEQFCGIRCSTRPDCIDSEILDILKHYGMTAIELGAQSMNDDVLLANRRGHTAEDVRRASKLIKQYGFELGLQMMTGLYMDKPEYCIQTAEEFIKLCCDTVRIYPTVILKGTELDRLKNEGLYDSFDFDQTVELCTTLLQMFESAGIPVIRLGLHASRDVEKNMTGGVYHQALREICESRALLRLEQEQAPEAGKYVFYTDRHNISKVTGHRGCNRDALLKRGVTFKIKEEAGTLLRAERIG